jgi:hypothetical protein
MAFPTAIQQILGPNPTRADIATVLIFGPVGLVVDGFLTIHGLPSPGVAGVATATAALGVKKAIVTPHSGRRGALRRANDFMLVLREMKSGDQQDPDASGPDEEVIDTLIQRLETHIKLCDRKAMKPADLDAFIAKAAKQLAR